MFSFLPLASTALLLAAFASAASAQPPDAPSSIAAPVKARETVRAPVAPVDPPPITSDALLTLLGGPTLVTLSGRDLKPQEIVDAFLQAAQLPPSRFKAPLADLKLVTVDWKNVPFWEAAREVETRSGGGWSARYGDGISLRAAARVPVMLDPFGFNPANTPPSLDGRVAARTPLVTLVANSISRTLTRGTRFGDEDGAWKAAPDRVQIALSSYFDPKLRVRSSVLREVKFQTREGAAALAGRPNFGAIQFRSGSASSLIAQHTLPVPDSIAAGTTLSRISGVLHLEVVTASENWVIAAVLAAPRATRTIGAGQFSFESAELRERDRELRLKLSAQLPTAPRAGDGSFASVRLLDAQNREVPGGASRLDREKAEFTFRLSEANPGPYALEWTIATETRSLDVPFELRDIVVP